MAEQADTTAPKYPKYPDVHVKLVGFDGNAFTVLGRVAQAMRLHGLSDAEVKAFMAEATAGDYTTASATRARAR